VSSSDKVSVTVEGRHLQLSNLEKSLYPEVGFTKGEVIDYYTRIAPVLLPHLDGRPVTTIRFPNGAGTRGFFQKDAPQGTPDWLRTVELPTPGGSSDSANFLVMESLPALVWVANLAALELHVPQWRVGPRGAVRQPDRLVVDLDPGPPAGLKECCRVAGWVREALAEDGITAYAKTSGKKGMQLMAAISAKQSDEVVSAYMKRVAERLAREHPDDVVAKMTKSLRPGKVFLDWSQNNAAKTTVAPYSLRAQSSPTVSTPVTWEEVDAGSVSPYSPADVLERVERDGDLLEGLATPGPRLPT
jgi:bifunctional non-homologous end joining protein LigD